MHASEKIVVLTFLACVALLYAAAGGMLLGSIWRKVRKRTVRHSRKFLWLRRVVYLLAAGGLICMAYGRFVEPRRLEVTHVRVASSRLVGATRPVRIVQISDVHCEPYAGLEETLPDVIAGLSPDVICFTGDAVNDGGAIWRFRRLMARLAKIAPTLAVRGNWDTGYKPAVDLMATREGVVELDGNAVKLNLAGADVWFAGASPRRQSHIWRALDAAPSGACKVLLYHYPDPILEVAARGDVDLQLSGHIHGGQVALPFYGAMVTLARHGKRFEQGLYDVSGTHLYVSRGIGMEGHGAPRVRFCARPEVTLIELAGVQR